MRFANQVLKVNDIVRHLTCDFLQFKYMVERSLSNLPVADNVVGNFAEKRRFHINWNVAFQVKQKTVA